MPQTESRSDAEFLSKFSRIVTCCRAEPTQKFGLILWPNFVVRRTMAHLCCLAVFNRAVPIPNSYFRLFNQIRIVRLTVRSNTNSIRIVMTSDVAMVQQHHTILTTCINCRQPCSHQSRTPKNISKLNFFCPCCFAPNKQAVRK